MSNWPKDTTKGETMTNEELAEKLDKLIPFVLLPSLEGIGKHTIQDAANRLRSFPDPTPEPVKDLWWLVERHEFLSSVLKWQPERIGDRWPWYWEEPQSFLCDSAALAVVRGIVKGLCNERIRNDGSTKSWGWQPNEDKKAPKSSKWKAWVGPIGCGFIATELEAIDALLTAMKGTE